MKLDSNMETDRLLQRFARHGRNASAPDGSSNNVFGDKNDWDNHGGSIHMDADELAAYSENALPVATRLRYTEHLSDCDSCRKLVTELVSSSGAAAKLEIEQTPPIVAQTRSWRDWLTVMFAPRVLRYAASVILLVGIVSIALVVYKSGMGTKFTSRSTPAADGTVDKNVESPASTSTESQPERGNGKPSQVQPEGENTRTITTPEAATNTPIDQPRDALSDLKSEGQKAGQDREIAKPPPPAVAADDGIFGKSSAKRDKDTDLADKQQPDSDVNKIKARKESESGGNTGRLSREAAARTEADESSRSDSASVAQSKTSVPSEEKSSAANRARSNVGGASQDSTPATGTVQKKSRPTGGVADGTRTVGGKQFVRRDGAWVDAAYRSQATTNVKRGSDQYRALLADEPGLRTIANQLGGEVVVVWNGRAYRIH